MRRALVLVSLAVATAQGASAAPSSPRVVTLLFGGDVMLGRGVAQTAARDPNDLFAGIRFQVSSADFAVANLESPLTTRPHLASKGPNALEAKPGAAKLVAAAGFDAMAIANNHAGDAGPGTVPDTVHALAEAGLPALGTSFEPRVVRVGSLRVAFLSFDATGEGPRPQVAWWDPARAEAAVRRARAEADVVVVGVHGGLEYSPATDPVTMRIGRLLAGWGADVVWGTGPHVVQPVHVVHAGGRTAIVATSLGNLLFDQHLPGTRQGALLEVLAGAGGVRAFRVGTTAQPQVPAVFGSWLAPTGDAAAIGEGWWTLARGVTLVAAPTPSLAGFPSKVTAAVIGDPEGAGVRQVVISFRRPFRPTAVNSLIPLSALVDKHGLTAHIGIYRPADLRPEWVAGTLLRPVARVAACDGSLAVAYSELNGTAVVGTGAWRWEGGGFTQLPDLGGGGTPGCADVDGDGRLDPVILDRSG